jgi:hypothetical protein
MDKRKVAVELVKAARELAGAVSGERYVEYNREDAVSAFKRLGQMAGEKMAQGDFIRALGVRKGDRAMEQFGSRLMGQAQAVWRGAEKMGRTV